MDLPGCPACRSARIREERYFGFLLNEYANDAATRDKILRDLGFCSRHTWVMTATERRRSEHPVGSSLLLEAILGEWTRRLEHPVPQPGRSGSMQRDACPACTEVARGTDGELGELVDAFDDGDERIRSRYEGSDGLCLEHLQSLLLLTAQDSPGRRAIVARTLDTVERVRGQLREFDRKRQWSARAEEPGPEVTAWQRAALIVGGAVDDLAGEARDVPWPREAS